MLEESSIDEQMVPFTGRIVAKQVMKSKSNPVGAKVFVRCSSDGLAHDFEFYQGKGTGVDPNHAHLGLGGSIVMRLVDHLPKQHNLKVYFDNYFTSVPLLRELKKFGILATGTIRSNRLMGCKLKPEKEMKKEERGSMDSRVTKEGDVVIVRWRDNGLVNMASTSVGVEPVGEARRWSEAKKEHVNIPCPRAVHEYNSFMGGVDKLDFVMSLYPLRAKTKKWPVRVICHFISFAVANSWLEYVRDTSAEGLPKNEVMDMMAFQVDAALTLIGCNKPVEKKWGRPSASQATPARQAHNAQPLPTDTMRYDGHHHWPRHLQLPFPQRCRLQSCTSKTRVKCRKSDVFLCLSANNDCFSKFHNKQP